jgi:hypothetical protein
MAVSRGKTLTVLSHVEDGKVVVQDRSGRALYSISLKEIHEMAEQRGVSLLLIGCETARSAHADKIPVAIVGKYNTAYAAERLAKALETSRNGAEFLGAVSGEGLSIVVQPGAWSPHGAGAAVYRNPSGPLARAQRLFRVWFMGRR